MLDTANFPAQPTWGPKSAWGSSHLPIKADGVFLTAHSARSVWFLRSHTRYELEVGGGRHEGSSFDRSIGRLLKRAGGRVRGFSKCACSQRRNGPWVISGTPCRGSGWGRRTLLFLGSEGFLGVGKATRCGIWCYRPAVPPAPHLLCINTEGTMCLGGAAPVPPEPTELILKLHPLCSQEPPMLGL